MFSIRLICGRTSITIVRLFLSQSHCLIRDSGWDTVAGAIIGTTTALAAYRMTYASIWVGLCLLCLFQSHSGKNYRINHIALPANPHGIWSAPPSHGMKGLTLNQEYGIRRDMSNWHEMRAASGV